MAEPRFRPGDRVVIPHGGRGHVWTVVELVSAAWESEPAYALDDGRRQRTASEGALEFAVGEVLRG